ncbi:TPA: hypothetical protein ACRZSU_001095 [Campylobacter jejuni]
MIISGERRGGGIIILEKNFNLDYILVEAYNAHFSIEVSSDFKQYINIDELLVCVNDKYGFNLAQRFDVKFIKIVNNTNSNINLKFYIRKAPLLLSFRGDGIGCRLSSLLVTMFLANKFSFNFGFIWNPLYSKITPVIKVEDFFKQDFVEQYCYNDKNISSKDFTIAFNTKELTPPKKLNNYWGEFISLHFLVTQYSFEKGFDKQNYRHEMRKIFNSLINNFHPNIQKLINKVENITKNTNNFIAFHLRNGDCLTSYQSNLYGIEGFLRIFPIEIALELISKELNDGFNIVLFTQDLDIASNICSYFNSDKIFIAKDLLPYFESNFERDFAELIFLRYAKKIYKPHSSLYSEIAYYIGFSEDIINIHKDLKPLYHLELIQQNYNKIYTNVNYEIIIKIYYFILKHYKILHHDVIEDFSLNKIYPLEEIFNLAFNYSYLLPIRIGLYYFLKENQFDKAEKLIKQYLNENNIDSLLGCAVQALHRSDIKNLLMKNNFINHPNLMFLKAYVNKENPKQAFLYIIQALSKETQNQMFLKYFFKFLSNIDIFNNSEFLPTNNFNEKKYFGAKKRIQNHLSYKLGSAMIKYSKKINLWFIMIPMLYKIHYEHYKNLNLYQEFIKFNPDLILPKLEFYADYKDGLKLKNHLSYKLGKALIKAHKNWYKFGYIKLIFDIIEIKKGLK